MKVTLAFRKASPHYVTGAAAVVQVGPKWQQVTIRGDVRTLFEMTRIAHDELKAIRPDNQILSPNITIHGVALLDEFLGMGGGKYVDIISWHHYPTAQPELSLPAITAVPDVMRRHSALDKPLWNTEGKPGGDPAVADQAGVPKQLSDDDARAAVARAYLIQWAYGVRRFCWYIWDEAEQVACVKLSRSTRDSTKPDYAALTPTGEAYTTVAQWLIGSCMLSKQIDQTGESQRWILEISRGGGYRGWIVWQMEGTSEFKMPLQWGVQQARRLDGGQATTTQGQIAIGAVPMLLENKVAP